MLCDQSSVCTTAFMTQDSLSLVTSSLDRSIKAHCMPSEASNNSQIWDARNTKGPKTGVRGSTAVSRFSATALSHILVPRDDKSAAISDFSGTRVGKIKTSVSAFSGLVL